MNAQSKPLGVIPIGSYSISLAIFFAVTAEMAPAGAVQHIADGFRVDISAAATGTAIYAITTAIFAIPLSFILRQADLRKAYIVVGGLFALTNLATALAPDFSTYLTFRSLNGVAHGAFFPVALALAATSTTSHPERSVGRALLGNAFALALGVPIGESLSASSWRLTFVLTAIGMLISIFGAPHVAKSADASPEVKAAPAPLFPLLLIGALFAGALAGHFAFYTFLAPRVEALGMPVFVLLSAYGTAVVLGTLLSGRLAEQARLCRAAFVLGTEALFLAAAACVPGMAVVSITAIVTGLCFGLLPTLIQSEMLVRSEGRPTIASGVAVVAFNSGIAGGAILGGVATRIAEYGPFLVAAIATSFASAAFFLVSSNRAYIAMTKQFPRRKT